MNCSFIVRIKWERWSDVSNYCKKFGVWTLSLKRIRSQKLAFKKRGFIELNISMEFRLYSQGCEETPDVISSFLKFWHWLLCLRQLNYPLVFLFFSEADCLILKDFMNIESSPSPMLLLKLTHWLEPVLLNGVMWKIFAAVLWKLLSVGWPRIRVVIFLMTFEVWC